MPNLHSAIADLAVQFTSAVLAAVRGATLGDIISETVDTTRAQSTPRGPGRPRSTPVATQPTPPAPAAPATRAAPERAPSRAKLGKLARRSPADIARSLEQVVALVKKNPNGIRSEHIQAELKMDRKEMPRVLLEGIAKKVLKRQGEKRATTYTAA